MARLPEAGIFFYLTPCADGASLGVAEQGMRPDVEIPALLACSAHGDGMARKPAAAKRRGRHPKTAGRKRSRARRATARRSRERRWSRQVTEHSDALTLEQGVFTSRDPKRIAASLKRSAERSRRRKADPFRSALSMLTFYINRAGKNLPASRKKTLVRAKAELRKQFGRE
jgi:Protein of unknown function (DUF3175)